MVLEISIVLLLCLLTYAFWHSRNEEQKRIKISLPPGPVEWPLIGGSLQVLYTAGFKGPYWQRFHFVAKKYGKTFGVKVGALKTVYTEDLKTVKEVLNSVEWAHRFPNHARFKEPMLGQNLGIMWSSRSESQKIIRKFVVRTLRTFGFGEMTTTEEFLAEEIFDFFQFLDKKRGNFQNEVFMHNIFKTPTLNILWRVMAGYRFPYDDPNMPKLVHAVDDIAKINIGLDPEWSFPFLRHIPGCSPSRAKRPSFVTCHQFFTDIKNQRRESCNFNKNQKDFIDFFLHKIDMEKDIPNSPYTDDQFQVTCVDLLFGGLDTTVNSIAFGILYMIQFQDVQGKVQAEIDSTMRFEFNRLPNMADRSKMKYCEAVMWETFRWANIVPIVARSNSTAHATIGGYKVKKDSLCALNLTAVHFSPEIWGESYNEFRPERFLNLENQIVNTEKLVAFGGGKRGCPGYAMARVTWLGFFIALLHRYTFKPSPRFPKISIEPEYGIANSPKPYYCIVSKRHL